MSAPEGLGVTCCEREPHIPPAVPVAGRGSYCLLLALWRCPRPTGCRRCCALRPRRDRGKWPRERPEHALGRGPHLEYDMPLVTNRFFLQDLVFIVLVAALGIQVLLLVFDVFLDEKPVLMPPEFWLPIVGVLVGLFAIACLAVYQNRYRILYPHCRRKRRSSADGRPMAVPARAEAARPKRRSGITMARRRATVSGNLAS